GGPLAGHRAADGRAPSRAASGTWFRRWAPALIVVRGARRANHRWAGGPRAPSRNPPTCGFHSATVAPAPIGRPPCGVAISDVFSAELRTTALRGAPHRSGLRQQG